MTKIKKKEKKKSEALVTRTPYFCSPYQVRKPLDYSNINISILSIFLLLYRPSPIANFKDPHLKGANTFRNSYLDMVHI